MNSRAYNAGHDGGWKWVLDGGKEQSVPHEPSPAAVLLGALSRRAWRDALGLARDERDNPASDDYDPWRALESQEVDALSEYNVGWSDGARTLIKSHG
jgi:hypothetical protein